MLDHEQPPATSSLPAERLEIMVRAAGGPEVLEMNRVAMPEPGAGEVLVRAEAAGVAFGDVTQRQGRNPGRMPPVLGYDVVGEIVALGAETESSFALGQRVAALTITGGYASHVIAPARWAVPVPEHLDAPAVSALTLNYLTARQLLHRAAGVQAGQSILVLGAAGGVGSALSELAQLAGVRVYGTASPHRHEGLRARGVEVVTGPDAVPELVDATFDPVGGPSLRASRRATKPDGIVVAYGFSFTVDGGHGRAVGLARAIGALLTTRITRGATVRSFVITSSAKRDPAALRADLSDLVRLLADGALHPQVEVLPLTRAADGHRRLEARQVVGKLVLVPDGPGPSPTRVPAGPAAL